MAEITRLSRQHAWGSAAKAMWYQHREKEKAKTPGSGNTFQAVTGRTVNARAAQRAGTQPACSHPREPSDECETAQLLTRARSRAACRAGLQTVFLNKELHCLQVRVVAPWKESTTSSTRATPGRGQMCQGILLVPNNFKALHRLIPSTDGYHAQHLWTRSHQEGKEETPLPSLAMGRDPEGQKSEGC